MSQPGLVDRGGISAWAKTRRAQGEFPRLVRRLILETSPDAVKLGMPAGDGVAAAGWDGTVLATVGNAWVPRGLSVWELSVGGSPEVKADFDYEKRHETPDKTPTSECTYVQAVLRPWPRREEWASRRRRDEKWRDVRALGLDEFEAWLESAPVTWAWLSEELGLHPRGARPASSWWSQWAQQTSPELSPRVVLAGRETEYESVLTHLSAPGTFTVGGGSVDELMAFIAAVAVESDARGDGRMLARTVFVDDAITWRQLVATRSPLLLVPLDLALARETPSRSPHTVLVPVAETSAPDLSLPPLNASEVSAALAGAGMADSRETREAGRLARRSLTAMRRHIATTPALHIPPWADPPVDRTARAVLIAGGWSDERSGDQEVLGQFAGETYDAFRLDAERLANAADPLVSRLGSTWYLVSPYDAWRLLVPHLTADDLERFRTNAIAVLGEDDPALDIPEEERWWKASFEGKVRAYSADLRRGMSRSLALLGIHGDKDTVRGDSVASWASAVVRELLHDANEDSTGRKWAAIADALPLLAEAGPDAFIKEVGVGLAGTNPLLATLFTDKEADGIFSPTSPHTHLLWALECLAWAPEYFGAAVGLLARLAAIDPGGRLSNRPSSSLAAIFCPWHPETSAERSRWLTVIDAMRKRQPEPAWALLVSMLPERHGVHMPTYEPRYRDWKPAEMPVLMKDYFSTVAAVAGRCIEDAGADVARWAVLIDRLSDLPPDDRSRVLHALSAMVEGETLTVSERDAIWNSLREMVESHREFPDADWSLDEEALEPFADLMSRIHPESALQGEKWLFLDHLPRIEGMRRSGDFEAYERTLAEKRAAAVRSIEHEGGLSSVLELASEAKVPGAVGTGLATTRPLYDREILTLLESEDRALLEFASSYVGKRFATEGHAWLGLIIAEDPRLGALAKARALLATRDYPKAWELAEQLGDAVEGAFWANFPTYGLGSDFPYVEHVASQLRRFGRHAIALDLVLLYRPKEQERLAHYAELVATSIESLLAREVDPELATLSRHDFTEAVALLEAQRDSIDTSRLAAIEWSLLSVLGHDADVPTLHEGLANDPAFFVEAIGAVYRPRTGETAEEGASAEGEADREAATRQALARNAYHLLASWTRPPGLRGTEIDSEELRTWLAEAEERLRESDRLAVGRVHVGHVLAKAPPDSRGDWPPLEVRDLIEEAGSEDIDSGFVTEVLNSRGVTSRGLEEGGEQELDLANRFRTDAERYADAWPRVASILRSVAASYEADANRNEHSAERFRRGLD